jgi:predicted methyltransferase MtxX (methanogen marker protein 4)
MSESGTTDIEERLRTHATTPWWNLPSGVERDTAIDALFREAAARIDTLTAALDSAVREREEAQQSWRAATDSIDKMLADVINLQAENTRLTKQVSDEHTSNLLNLRDGTVKINELAAANTRLTDQLAAAEARVTAIEGQVVGEVGRHGNTLRRLAAVERVVEAARDLCAARHGSQLADLAPLHKALSIYSEKEGGK